MIHAVMQRWKKGRRGLAAAFLLAAVAVSGRAGAATVEIGWTAWADAEFTTKLARRLIEDELGHTVNLTLLDIALQYQGVARGDLDAMLMAWLPDTHADYWKRYGQDIDDLGVLYENARLGWVVPAYVPESAIASIADLKKPAVADRLQRQIYGIDPGAGLMRLSEEAMAAYGLDHYNLIRSSGAAMTAMVERAHRRDRWIVATAWRPHWMFHTWDLRFLDDPKGALGGAEKIHVMARQGLRDDLPDVAGLLSRMYLPLDELEAAMGKAQETSYDAAVDAYIAAHPKRIHYWLTGARKTESD